MTLFLDAFKNLELDSEDRENFKQSEVLQLVVPEDRSALTIYIRSANEIPRSSMFAVEKAIREKIFLNKQVQVSIIDTQVHPKKDLQANKTSAQAGKPAEKKNIYGRDNYKETRSEFTPRRDKKSENPDVFYGYDFSGKSIPMSSLQDGMGEVILQGSIFSLEDPIHTKNGKCILKFNITDETDSVSCRVFCDENSLGDLQNNLKIGSSIMLTGTVTPPNQYSPEMTISNIRNIKKATGISNGREDRYEGEKRTELMLHTNTSEMDAVGDVSKFIKTAISFGWDSLAITDTDSVQAFPKAAHSLPKDSSFKIIYGMNGHLVDDAPNAVSNPKGQSLDDEFVVFDLETTGFSQEKCRIIEIGAVKVREGKVIDRFSEFVDPGFLLPPHIIELTKITDADVSGKGGYEIWIPRFLEFCGNAPVVGHNAQFDVGFVRHYSRILGLEFEPSVVDTLGLSHLMLKDLFRNKLDNVAKELGVSLGNHHRAVDDAEATAGIFLKFREMLKERGIRTLDELFAADIMDGETVKKLHGYSFDILVKNDFGRTNLYRLVSAAHIDYFHINAKMPKSKVNALRNGLLIGSGNEESELFDGILRGLEEERLEKIASFYDYLEILPPSNLMYLIKDNKNSIETVEDIRNCDRMILQLGRKLGKPVVASGDVHFPERSDSIYRKILNYFESSQHGRGDKFDDERYDTALHLKTTQEMLDEFMWLGEETAKEVVIKNPRMLSDMCERIEPVRPDKCPPVIENSDQDLREMCYKKAHRMYGDPLPELVGSRLDKELNSIISNGYSVMYIIAQRLIKDSMDHGYLVGSRGSVGSSLVATMADISEVNPLPPHYRCESCHYVDFDSETVKQYKEYSGCDMPDMNCPICGKPMIKDGFDIPFETFLGFSGDKEPDIDLNFAGDYQAKAHKYTDVLFGEGNTFKAGTMGTVQEKTAYGYVLRYNEDHNITTMRSAEKTRLALGCTEVLRTTGQHPGGIIVLPHGEEINSFTPIQHPANVMTNPITTHFDYHSIDHNLLKLDILGKDDPSMIRQLQDMSGIDPMEIPVGVPEVMQLFKDTSSLGINPEDIGGTKLGTLGIPEFGTDFAIQMLLDAKPQYVSDLVRIAGLAHGTDVWLGNAQTLIEEGKCTIQTAICTRDDIMIYLISMGVEPSKAFKIMELVRKGKFVKNPAHDDYVKMMKDNGVPDWYIWSCNKIAYMFPKAHAAAYVVMALRIAWFKVFRPKEYYTAYFTVKGKGFDYEKMCVPLSTLKSNLAVEREKLSSNRDASANDKLLVRDMRIAEEMMERGISFKPIDIFKAKATEYTLTEDGMIMPPFNSIAGLGDSAAESLVEDAKSGIPYLSLEEFISRTKVSKTNAELMKNLGILGDLSATNQLSIFDMIGS